MITKESAELLVLVKKFTSQFVVKIIRLILMFVSYSVIEYSCSTKDNADSNVCVRLFINQYADQTMRLTQILVKQSVKD